MLTSKKYAFWKPYREQKTNTPPELHADDRSSQTAAKMMAHMRLALMMMPVFLLAPSTNAEALSPPATSTSTQRSLSPPIRSWRSTSPPESTLRSRPKQLSRSVEPANPTRLSRTHSEETCPEQSQADLLFYSEILPQRWYDLRKGEGHATYCVEIQASRPAFTRSKQGSNQ